MDGLRSERDDNAGNEAGEFGDGRRRLGTGAWCAILRGPKPLNHRLGDWRPEPARQAAMAQDAEVWSANRFGAQHRGAQRLVVVGGAGRGAHLGGRASDFFLRAIARSKLRRCTLMPNCASMAATHCEVVNSGCSALRLLTNATTSAEILWPPFGPRGCGTRPATPEAASVP